MLKKPFFSFNLVTGHWFFRSVLTTTFSIFLAFTIDRIYDQYRENQQIVKIFKILYLEQQSNIAILDTAIQDIRAIRKIILEKVDDPAISLMQIVSEPPYLNSDLPAMQAHRFLLQQDGVKDNFDLISRLSAIDDLYSVLEKQSDRMGVLLYSPSSNSTQRDGQLNKEILYNITGNYAANLNMTRNKFIAFIKYAQEQQLMPKSEVPPH